MLLMSWVVLGIVPSNLALAGFSHNSWFFVVSALGLGAAVNKSGLLNRLALRLLRRIPLSGHKTHSFVLFASGILITPLLPSGKARAVIALPVSQAIANTKGYADRSNGSVALSLAALIGFTHMSFMFLTGGTFCLIGWNLLPGEAKAEFGWMTWFLAALPAGILIFFFVFTAIHLLFPLNAEDKVAELKSIPHPNLENPGPLTGAEWIGVLVLALTLVGWLTKPLHGIDETWVALGGLLVFLTTGCLDKKSFRNNLDWGLIVFYGIINSMAVISQHLKIDRWVGELIAPVLADVAANRMEFLIAVIMIVCLTRLCLRKAPTIILVTLILLPLGHNIGIHPGVILLTILAASECFVLPYQDGPYQIAYSSIDGQAFSHRQARKVLAVRYVATTVAIAVSVPYWKLLGLIQ
jgi:anion transporter